MTDRAGMTDRAPAPITTVFEFSFVVELGDVVDLGRVRGGRRLCFPVVGGRAIGARISGTVLPGGADWMLVADGWGRLDVRAQVATESGAVINMTYGGWMELTDAFASGRETGFDEHYFRCAPELECGDEELAWVNTSLFVSRGRIVPGGVEYEVFRVE